MAKFTENEMWIAAIENDKGYDGNFFYAVITTGIVCRPSCKSKTPKRENVLFFFSLDEALQKGFRPCKRCRPDLGTNYNPVAEPIHLACELFTSQYYDPTILENISTLVGISPFHFQRLFKKVTGKTPKEFLQQIRVNQAVELLSNTNMSVTEISLAAGFVSLSSFYSVFRCQKGCSPKEYMKQAGMEAITINEY